MATVGVGDVQMHVEEIGVPEGRPMILLHGFAGTGHGDWGAQIEAFRDEYRVIVPDLRGHGRTDNPAGRDAMNHRQFAADVAGLCDVLGLSQAVIVGESTGSMLQLSLLSQRPDLVAASVLGAVSHAWSADLRQQFATLGRDELAAMWFPDADALHDFRAVHTALGDDHWRTLLGDFLALFHHHPRDDLPDEDELRTIQTPVLIVHGDRDPLFDLESTCQLYRLLPDAELCVLPNTSHFPPSEKPAAFNLLVTDFLDRRLGDRGKTP